MFKGTPVSTSDSVWAKILSDLYADVSDNGIYFEKPTKKLTSAQLETMLNDLKIQHLKGIGAAELSDTEQKLILMLPASVADLKLKMGYANTSKTHTMETLIWNIRKKLGKTFIKFEDGIYKL